MDFGRADDLIKAILTEGGLGMPPPSKVASRKKWSASPNPRKSSIGAQFTQQTTTPVDLEKRIQQNGTDKIKDFKPTPPVTIGQMQGNDDRTSPEVQAIARDTSDKRLGNERR